MAHYFWQNNADKKPDSQMMQKSDIHIQQIVPTQASPPLQVM